MDDVTAVVIARSGRNGAVLATIALLVVACATPEPPKPPAAPPPPVVAAPEPPKPVAPPVPELSPAQAKAQGQKLANESVAQLQNGDEASAKHGLEQALALDPANDLAKKMMGQIKADPQKELGATFFRYTVQPDDSLSKIAQQYMGDRYRFYILAKYNDIQNPSRIAAGQVIKIPGKAPTAAVAPPVPPPPEPTPPPESKTLSDADAASQRDSVRQAQARRCEREAKQAFAHQNLAEAIDKWNCVLALEPDNEPARLERQKVLKLQEQLKKFDTK